MALDKNDGIFLPSIEGVVSGKTSQVTGMNGLLNNLIGNDNYLKDKKLDRGNYNGTAEDLSNDTKSRLPYVNTIEDLKKQTKYVVGDIVEVLGYYSIGDGAGHKRKIEETDDGSGVQLANGLWANIVHNGEVNVSWFGAKGDGVTDDTVAIQKALDFEKLILFDSGEYLFGKLILNKDNKICGYGMNETKLICTLEQGTVFMLNVRSCLSNFRLEFKKWFYGDIFGILSSKTAPVIIGENQDDREITVENLFLQGMYSSAKNLPSFEGNVFKLLGDSNSGIYKFVAKNVTNHRCGVFVDIECLENSWVNSNKFLNCFSFGNYGLYKMAVGLNSEIRDNEFDVNFQNDINFKGKMLYDIPTTSFIKDNKFRGYVWDLSNTLDINEGNVLGNLGMNIESLKIYNTRYISNSINFIGTLSKSPGISFVELRFGTYATKIPKIIKILVNDNKSLQNIFHQIGDMDIEIFYKEVEGVYYLFFKTLSNFVQIDILSSGAFTYGSYFAPIYDSIGLTKLNTLKGNSPINVTDETIQGLSIALSKDSRIDTAPITSLEALIYQKNKTSMLPFVATGVVLGLNQNKNYNCMFFDLAGYTSSNHYGSSILAISQDGEFYINSYKNGIWGIWKTFTYSTYSIQALNTPYHTLKMQQEGVYEDFIAYMDEKTGYDRSQRELEQQRQLAFEQSGVENYEEWLAEQPMLLPADNEPQPSEALLKFKEKYLG